MHLKKNLHSLLFQIYETHRYTLFCEQAFHSDGELILPRCKTCPTTPLQIVWMPIVPLKTLASTLPCYREKICVNKKGKAFGGIRCCQKMDPLFKKMSSDLRNYVPENPVLVKLRKHYGFQESSLDIHSLSGCHFVINKQLKTLSPSPRARGFIARTYLYFHQEYHLPLSTEEKNTFLQWHTQYPTTPWEEKREQLIFEKQENDHSYAFKNR